MNDYKSIDERLDEMMGAIDAWYQDERQHFIETHSSEIERKASKLEVTCDYYLAEFV